MAIEPLTERVRSCKRCGAPISSAAPLGQCPKCLLNVALGRAAPSAEEKSDGELPSKIRLFGDYELLDLIARGGMGSVYRARQVSLNRIVALKMISTGDLASPIAIERFRTEAEAAARLEHPNIVPIYEIGVHEDQHYFTMRFLEGGTLTERLSQGRFSPERSVDLLITVARAVHHAHRFGILHRDIKPGNILFDSKGEPFVADFSLAKLLGTESGLTRSSVALGTPSYMAPEQITGGKQLSTATDVYGLGAVLYQSLTGEPPFSAASPLETMRLALENEPLRPRTRNPAVNRDLETICLKCLEKDPIRRYGSAEDLADDLDAWRSHRPLNARPATTGERVIKWARRKPAVAGLVAALHFIAVAGLLGIIWQARRANQHSITATAEAERAMNASQAEREQRTRAEQNEARALQSEELARRAEQETRQRLYAADMAYTGQALREGNLGQAREYLRSHIPGVGQVDLRGFEWRYYWRETEGEQVHTFTGHSNVVFCVAFSPDGRLLASGGWDGQIFLWHVSDRSRIASFQPGGGEIRSIVFNASGDLMAVGAQREASLWRMGNPRQPSLLVRRVALEPRIAFVPGTTRLIMGQNQSVWGYSFEEGFADIWDYQSGSIVRKFEKSGGRISLPLGGNVLFTGVRENTVFRWDLTSAEAPVRAEFKWPMRNMACSPDGRWLIINSGEDDNRIELWDGRTLQPVRTLLRHPEKTDIWSVAFSADSRLAATAHSDQLIRVWNLEDTSSSVLRGHGRDVRAVAFSPDGTLVASGGEDETVRLWDLRLAAEPKVLTNIDFDQWQQGPAFSPDGKTLAIGGAGATVELWNVEPLGKITSLTNTSHVVRFSQDGKQLITLDDTVTLKTWDLATRTVTAIMAVTNVVDRYRPFALTPDAQHLVSASREADDSSSLVVWNLTTHEQRRRVKAHHRALWAIHSFPKGDRFVTCGEDRFVRIWDLSTLEPLDEFGGHKDQVFGAALSSDGSLLATASIDGTAKVWNIAEHRELWTLKGHKRGVLDIVFNADGKTLATCSDDGSVRLWNLATGRQVGYWQGLHQTCWAVFSPDGSRLVIVDASGTARIWNAPYEPLKTNP